MTESVAVCVLGMHRSGTSLVARFLDLLGVRLGPPGRLMEATERNPRGYWEHRELSAVSEEILERFGGHWEDPAPLPADWTADPRLADLADRAREIFARDFGDAPVWGWKDPRLSLTLPFWQAIVPAMRAVVCLRDPRDVAGSVAETVAFERGTEHRPSLERGLGLWVRYTAAALESTSGGPRLFVRYEDVMADPQRELERLARFVDGAEAAADPRVRQEARAEADPALWRHRARPAADDPSMPAAVQTLWAALELHLRETQTHGDAEDPGGARELGRLAAACAEELAPELPPAAAAAPAAADGRLTLSVAMCTFRGARYLPEQLDSLAAQTRPPDELVVCDDGSDDDTLQILERFAEAAPFLVRVHRNARRMGSTKNFERAIGLCQGDVVLLCDQDDAWAPGKLGAVEAAFRERPELAAVFTDADLMDEASRPLGGGLWDALGITPGLQRSFAEGDAVHRIDLLCRGNLVTGTCLGFRSAYRDLLLPVPATWVQDAWIGLLLSAVAPIRMSGERPVRYRLHASQQIGIGVTRLRWHQDLVRRAQVVRRMTKRERPAFLEQASRFRLAGLRLRAYADRHPCPPGVLRHLEEKAEHFQARGRMTTLDARWPLVRRELRAGRYRRYSNGWPSVAKDLLLLDRLGAR